MILKKIFHKIKNEIWKFKYFYEKNKYKKQFSSFDEAKLFCEINSNNSKYTNSKINELKVYEFENFSEKLLLNMNAHLLSFLECLHIYSQKFSSPEFYSILEIGGSTGINALFLRQKLKIETDYNIIENSKLVELLKKKNFLHSNFFQDIQTFKKSIQDKQLDFVYSRGTIHYLENPYEALEKIISLKPNAIFLSNINLNINDKFYSEYSMLRHHIQQFTLMNMKENNFDLNEKILIPSQALNLDKIKKIFETRYNLFLDFNTDGTQFDDDYSKNLFF